MNDNDNAKQQLVATLKSRRAVLLAGAGSSRFVGYPSWPQLVEGMRARYAGGLSWPDEESPMTFASTIVAEIRKRKEMEAYHNFLERTFEPRTDRSKLHDNLHVALV